MRRLVLDLDVDIEVAWGYDCLPAHFDSLWTLEVSLVCEQIYKSA